MRSSKERSHSAPPQHDQVSFFLQLSGPRCVRNTALACVCVSRGAFRRCLDLSVCVCVCVDAAVLDVSPRAGWLPVSVGADCVLCEASTVTGVGGNHAPPWKHSSFFLKLTFSPPHWQSKRRSASENLTYRISAASTFASFGGNYKFSQLKVLIFTSS